MMFQMKENLVLRGVQDLLGLPSSIKSEDRVAKVIDLIVQGYNDELNKSHYNPATEHIEIFVKNLEKACESFKIMVQESAKSRETGRSVGKILEMQLINTFPHALIGGKKNKLQLLKNVKKSFAFGKEDAVSTSVLTTGIDLRKVLWLKSIKNPSEKRHVMTALLLWLWQVTKRLVTSAFYVSHLQGSPNELVYIPRKVWQSETDQAFNQLILQKRIKLLTADEANQMTALRKPGILRWIPKIKGLRPIISVADDKTLANNVEAKNLLNLLVKQNSKINGKTMNILWSQLADIKRSGNKLYFVSCDLNDAFGSIIQEKLIAILEDEIKREFGPAGLSKYENVICHIKNVVQCQTVRKNKNSFLMTKGVGQGTTLSSALCNLYLGHMDRTCLSSFTNRSSRLLRAVDDYLYVTTRKDQAQLFLNTMESGLPGYGMMVNLNKTQSNLKGDGEIAYYGYTVNTENMEVYPRYTQGVKGNFLNSLVFKNEPIMCMSDKLLKMPFNKLNQLTLDRRYMSVEGEGFNVFCTACLLARRLTSILSLTRPCDVPSADFIVKTICCSVETVIKRVCKVGAAMDRSLTSLGESEKAKRNTFLRLDCKEIEWICLRAFQLVVSQAINNCIPADPDILHSLIELEEAAKSDTRPEVELLLTPVVKNIPDQFKHFP